MKWSLKSNEFKLKSYAVLRADHPWKIENQKCLLKADFRDALSIIILKTWLSSRQSHISQIWSRKNPQTWFLMHPLWTIFYSGELSASWKGFSWCLNSPSKQLCYTICKNREAFESVFFETPLQKIIMSDHQVPLHQIVLSVWPPSQVML